MDAELRSLLPPRVCGRRFHPRTLRMIRQTIAEYHHTHRAEITRQVCERLGWVDARGRLKIAGAAVALRRLHRKGRILHTRAPCSTTPVTYH